MTPLSNTQLDAADVCHDRVAKEAVQDRRGHHLALEDVAPGGERAVGGEADRPSRLVASVEDLEEGVGGGVGLGRLHPLRVGASRIPGVKGRLTVDILRSQLGA